MSLPNEEDYTILIRWFQLICPDAIRNSLLAELLNIYTAQPTDFMLSVGLGPEFEPDCGYSITITHWLDGPAIAEETYQDMLIILQNYPDASIQNTRWMVVDENEPAGWKFISDNPSHLMNDFNLKFYDEAMVP